VSSRLVVLEGFLTAAYLSKFLVRGSKLDYFHIYLSFKTNLDGLFTGEVIQSLLNIGLRIKENGYLPYVSLLYLQELETRMSVIALNILSLLVTREHYIDRVKTQILHDPLMNLMILNIMNEKEKGEIDQVREVCRRDNLAFYLVMSTEIFNVNIRLTGLYNLVRNPYECENTLLKGSMKRVRFC
jgi:hypothetical protein